MSNMQDGREAVMIGSRTDGTPVRRPLSPHLQVYDMMQITSSMSISHRITGVAWAIGLLFLVWWLTALAAGPGPFAAVQWFLGSVLGWLVLMGLTAVAWYHTLNGLRHLAWDAGYGFDIPTTYRSGRMVLVGTAALTGITWLILFVAWI
ncbi:MAG TPA: succinate dehydrogenase, cytochrome b556 subunit [Roseomonas sp.]|jgi:succinate dehydrogenase / fumarate reductase cytochrome b subunit